MSFGNSSDIGTNIYSDTGFDNIPVEGFSTDSGGYEIYPSDITSGISLDDYSSSSGGGKNWGSIINTLGRLGSGILGGMADYNSSSSQQAYIPYTQWLGNGLAKFSAINNTGNKQQQSNNAYGNALMLSSLFGRGLGRKQDTI